MTTSERVQAAIARLRKMLSRDMDAEYENSAEGVDADIALVCDSLEQAAAQREEIIATSQVAYVLKAIALYQEKSPRASALPDSIMRLVRELQEKIAGERKWIDTKLIQGNARSAEGRTEVSRDSELVSKSLATVQRTDTLTLTASEDCSVTAAKVNEAQLWDSVYPRSECIRGTEWAKERIRALKGTPAQGEKK